VSRDGRLTGQRAGTSGLPGWTARYLVGNALLAVRTRSASRATGCTSGANASV